MKLYLTPKTLKKIIKMLVLFILACVLIYFCNTLSVNAQTIPSNCHFYDNRGSSQTYLLTIGGADYWKPENSFTLTANSYGGLIICTLDTPLVKDNLYSLSMYVELEGTTAETKLSSKSNLGIGNSFENARLSYVNNTNTSLKYSNASANNLSYIFTANINASYIAIPFGSSATVTTTPKLTNLSVVSQGNANNLTQNDIQNIISNSNEELKNSIENSNEELKDSIENSNEELKEEIKENFNSCEKFSVTLTTNDIAKRGYYLDYEGNYFESSNWGVSRYVSLPSSSATYTITGTTGNNPSFCLYDKNKTLLTCTRVYGTNSYTFSNSNLAYIRTSIPNDLSNPQIIVSTTDICQNKLDSLNDTQKETNDKLDDLNDNITNSDTSGADEEASGFFNDFESNDFGLSDIITLPLTTIESITSKSCTPLNLTLPFVNKTFQLPCMTTIYSKFEPFYSIYQTITFGVISYWVCVQIYAMVKGFKDPAKDEIEVMDL